jgi:hypothetical protein
LEKYDKTPFRARTFFRLKKFFVRWFHVAGKCFLWVFFCSLIKDLSVQKSPSCFSKIVALLFFTSDSPKTPPKMQTPATTTHSPIPRA